MQTYSIIGAARSGLAVARLLRQQGESVFVSDAKPIAEAHEQIDVLEQLGIPYEFGGHSERVLEAKTIVLSPGVPPTIPVLVQAREKEIEITNEIEVASRFCKGRIVGITGTNGKTTTTELTGHIFRQAGWKTFVAGNVGTPFSEVVRQTDEESIVVLELSSFQLEEIKTLRPTVAVLLNVTPDHLDRYANLDAYGAAKLRIAMNQNSKDWLIYNVDDAQLSRVESDATEFNAQKFGFSVEHAVERGAFVEEGHLVLRFEENGAVEKVVAVEEIGIRGPHNLMNAMAASLAARSIGVSAPVIREALKTFRALPHRLEEVATINGVRYVNDSKGTNTDALRYALESFDAPIVLIAGGRAKKNDYTALLPLITKHVKAAVLIGEAADGMEEAFGSLTKIVRAGFDIEQAMSSAAAIAEAGDVVLLSPACASFDMFKNFEHRGDVFRAIVLQESMKCKVKS